MKNIFKRLIPILILCGLFLFGAGPVTRIRLLDTNYSNYLQLMWNEDRVADQTLDFITGAADRTITLSGNPTLADWFDQSVKQAASPSFVTIYLYDSNQSNGLRFRWNEDRVADQTLDFITGAADRTITLSGNPTLADWFDQAVKAASAVTFATVDTGQGANELYDMDQNVLQASSPTFVGGTFSGLTASVPVVTSAGSALASQTYANFKTSLVLAQADISGLTTASSPVFVTAKLSGLTDGYVPYHVADNTGLGNSNVYTDASNVFIGDTTNAKATLGLTINQAANDNEIFSLKSSDINHTVTTDTEADTFGYITKYSATLGGILFRGITDADAAGAMVIEGIIGATDPTDTNAAFILIGSKQTGTTTAALAATETVFQFKNRTTNLVTILGSGNFGIGTTSPGYALDVAVTGTPVKFGDAAADNIKFTPDSVAAYNAGTPKIFYINYSGGNVALVATGGGNVSIGTTDIEAWGNPTIEFATTALHQGGTNGLYLASNVYNDGAYKFKTAAVAAFSGVENGEWRAYTSPTGLIDAACTLTLRAKVNNAGDFYTNDGTVHSLSDKKAKEKTREYNYGLKEILQLTPAFYKHKKAELQNLNLPISDNEFVSLEAQDVQKIIPEAIKNAGQGYLGLTINPIVYAQINAIKELDARMKAIEAKIK